MQMLSLFSSSKFFSWCKSGVHRNFHREAGFNPAAPRFLPGGRFQPGGTRLYTGRLGVGPDAHRFFTGNHLWEVFRRRPGAHRPVHWVPRRRARRHRVSTGFARDFAPTAIFRFAIKGDSSPTIFFRVSSVFLSISLTSIVKTIELASYPFPSMILAYFLGIWKRRSRSTISTNQFLL
jgi:hypothetical protein